MYGYFNVTVFLAVEGAQWDSSDTLLSNLSPKISGYTLVIDDSISEETV